MAVGTDRHACLHTIYSHQLIQRHATIASRTSQSAPKYCGRFSAICLFDRIRYYCQCLECINYDGAHFRAKIWSRSYKPAHLVWQLFEIQKKEKRKLNNSTFVGYVC